MAYVDNPLNPTGTPDWVWEQEHSAGGGTPEWLPEAALAYADFINSQYFAGGSSRAITDVIDTTGCTVDASGIRGPADFSTRPMVIGSLKDDCISSVGKTFVFEFDGTALVEANGIRAGGPPATNYFVLFDSGSTFVMYDWQGSDTINNADFTPGGIIRCAVNVLADHYAYAVNGGAVSSPGTFGDPFPLAAAALGSGTAEFQLNFFDPVPLRLFAVLDPVADADLPALSALEGGGETPVWPVDLDFANEAYLLAGAPTPLANIVEEDTDWGTWSGTVGVAGLTGGESPAFKAAVATPYLAGATFVVDAVLSTTDNLFVEMIDFPDWNNEIFFTSNNATDTLSLGGNDGEVTVPGITGAFRAAFTIIPNETTISLSLSVNGGVTQSTSFAGGALPTDIVFAANGDSLITKLLMGLPRPDADLPTLSAPP